MKKFFTLIAAVAMAASVNAQGKLIDFPTSKTGITLHSVNADQIVYSTVKIRLRCGSPWIAHQVC